MQSSLSMPSLFSRSKKSEEAGRVRLFYGHPRDGMFVDNMSIGQAFSLQANARLAGNLLGENEDKNFRNARSLGPSDEASTVKWLAPTPVKQAGQGRPEEVAERTPRHRQRSGRSRALAPASRPRSPAALGCRSFSRGRRSGRGSTQRPRQRSVQTETRPLLLCRRQTESQHASHGRGCRVQQESYRRETAAAQRPDKMGEAQSGVCLFTASAVSRVSALRPGSSHLCSVRLKSTRRNPWKPKPGILCRSL